MYILREVRLTNDGDVFGTVQMWRFALCDYILDEFGINVPGFRPSAFGPERDAYEFQILSGARATLEECQYALKILDRARLIIGAEGMDY